MAMLTLEFKSATLLKETTVKIILNQGAKPPYPTFYLLHGLSDNESIWTRHTSLERYARDYPFLIVMPDGGRSWYCDSGLGNYETFIMQELVSFIDITFHTRRQARYRAVGGLSMGGYGALKLGLKFPRVFGSISAHSSAVDFMHLLDTATDIPELPLITDGMDLAANDPFQLALACPERIRPHIYFDCGRSDFLYAGNERFHQHLTKNNILHTFKRFPGAHEWSYWDAHVQDALKFHVQAMGL